MGNLGTAGDRLKAYREEHLGFTLAEMEAHFKVSASTFSYSETQGKGISSKIYDSLTRTKPPAGKQRIDIKWLTTGKGNMLLPPDNLQIIQDMDSVQAAAAQSDAQSKDYSGPPILPSEVAMAAKMVDAVAEAMPPEAQPKGAPKWEAVARVARLLALDRVEGTEGTARAWLMGVRQEWAKAQTKTGA